MANEAEIINNPDSTPGAVSTGYQAQNTNLVAQRAGLDCSVVTPGTGNCKLEISGPVDVNGILYTINSEVTFTLSTAGKYYIHLAGSGANLTPTIGTGANTFDADKNARYTDSGNYRVLNWVIYYDGTTSYVHRLINPYNDRNDLNDGDMPAAVLITTNGETWTAPRTKVYKFSVFNQNVGSVAVRQILVNAGDVWTVSIEQVYSPFFTKITNSVTEISVTRVYPGTYSYAGEDYLLTGIALQSRGHTNYSGVLIEG